MTPEEIEFYKIAVEEICKAWVIGCIALAIGIGSISINNILGKQIEELLRKARGEE